MKGFTPKHFISTVHPSVHIAAAQAPRLKIMSMSVRFAMVRVFASIAPFIHVKSVILIPQSAPFVAVVVSNEIVYFRVRVAAAAA